MAADDADTARHLEIERKFDVDESTPAPSFDGIAGVTRVEHAETQRLDAVYFDTSARDLASRRITLRRRTGGSDAGWHLKLPAGPDVRTEVHAPLGADSHPPAELLDVVVAVIRDRPVSPVARISTVRAIQVLHRADGSALAEFCDDRVTAGQGADGSIATQRWREWELELVGDAADGGVLDPLGAQLLDAGARPAGHGSKLARVLGTGAVAPEDPQRSPLGEQLDRLLMWDRAARAGVDDAVHQMRLTVAAIGSLLQRAPFGFADDAPIVDELRELGDALRDSLATLRLPRYFRLLDELEALLV